MDAHPVFGESVAWRAKRAEQYGLKLMDAGRRCWRCHCDIR